MITPTLLAALAFAQPEPPAEATPPPEPPAEATPEATPEPTPDPAPTPEPTPEPTESPTEAAPEPTPTPKPAPEPKLEAPAAQASPKPEATTPATGAEQPQAPEGSGAPSDQALARQSNVDPNATRGVDKFGRPGSPQRFAAEIKLGPYLPDVDRDYNGPGLGPYATVFGRTNGDGVATDEPRQAVMPIVGFEWQFYYFGGPIGLGTQVAFFRDSAQAILTNPEPDDMSTRSDADDLSFTIVPISALVSYRFSLLADRVRVPLVPYAKAGPSYAFWWTRNGRGNIARDNDGDRGSGGVWGFLVSAGLMLRLDFIEPGTAKRLDQVTGINHTYVFGEFQYSQLDNFGVGNAISLGDATWFAGLAIEF